MDNKNTLNGFEAIFEQLSPVHVGKNEESTEEDTTLQGDIVESLTDEELEELRNPKKGKTSKKELDVEEEEIDDEEVEEEPVRKVSKKNEKQEVKEDTDDDVDNDISSDDDETNVIVGFFDSLSEKLGWEDVEEDEKPKTAEDLIEYFKDVIEDNSTPKYSSEEVEKLDEFVRNGGDLKDYFSIDADLDVDSIEIEDNEVNQKLVVKELLKEKGFSIKQIDKKISKYEEAGILEDEATDALEALRDIKTQRKEELLASQEKQAREAEKQQREFFQNVVSEIKGMDSIYGIDIPEKDKKALLEYIFKPDASGVTRYQKDYAKSLKNLITSAYFTMKGDSLIDIAKKKGKKDALDNFKNSLTKNSGVNKKSRRQVINTDDDINIWSSFTRQLRVA